MKKQAHSICTLLAIVLFSATIITTGIGYIDITPFQVIQVLYADLFNNAINEQLNPVFPVVVMDVRLPRIITSVLVGGGLASAGCVFQSLLLNPLADPYTLGISSGAAFGASLALILGIFGIMIPHWFSIPLFAFTGALLTLFFVFYLSGRGNKLSSNTLILSGVIVSAILSAGIGFVKYLADDEVNIIIYWLMGSLIGKSWSDVLLVFSLLVPSLVVLFFYAKDLNIMSLGSKTSDALGIDTLQVRRTLLIASSLITAGCVSVSGIIGFIGLIIPHLLRLIIGPDNRVLLPACFLGGGLLLLLADTITRAYLPTEIPIGVLTSLIGGPFFCYIFRKKQLSVQ